MGSEEEEQRSLLEDGLLSEVSISFLALNSNFCALIDGKLVQVVTFDFLLDSGGPKREVI